MRKLIYITFMSLAILSCSDNKKKNRYLKHIEQTKEVSANKDPIEPISIESPVNYDDSQNYSLYITLVVDRIDLNGQSWCGNIGINKLVNGISKKYEVGDTLVIQLQ